jgi:hypothetical protein
MVLNSSFLTWRFDTALQFASGLHHDQARKGGHIPYVAHLMRELGEGLWSRFNAPKEDQLWFYGAIVTTLRQTAAQKPLVDELGLVVEELNELAK